MNTSYKLHSFEKSLKNLNDVIVMPKSNITRDAAIKRYELCYELAWKSVQEALKNEGLEVCKSPKSCFKEAFKQGWIVDEKGFSDMLEGRNMTTHTYDETLADAVYNHLATYLSLLDNLFVKLSRC